MNIKSGRYKNTGYATAGSSSRFHVGDAAYLPDSDAGTDLAGCYRARGEAKSGRAPEYRTVSFRTALAIAGVVLFLCMSVVASRYFAVRGVQSKVDTIITGMERTRSDNTVLRSRVDSVRDLSRIGYIAVTRLGMVASDDWNTIEMYVPQVEAFAGTVERGPGQETNAVYETAGAREGTAPNVAGNGIAAR